MLADQAVSGHVPVADLQDSVCRNYISYILQESGKQGSGLSTYVIAQAQARFADAFGLEMKVVELVPDKMAGKSEAELRGDNIDSNC